MQLIFIKNVKESENILGVYISMVLPCFSDTFCCELGILTRTRRIKGIFFFFFNTNPKYSKNNNTTKIKRFKLYA